MSASRDEEAAERKRAAFRALLGGSNERRGDPRLQRSRGAGRGGAGKGMAGAGVEQGPGGLEAPGAAGGPRPDDWRDWAGLPEELLVKVAEKLVAQTEAEWLRRRGWLDFQIQTHMEVRKRDGSCLFVFARVCKPWRKAQIKVGGPLRTRVESDVIMPGRVALAKWALAEGCPREGPDPPPGGPQGSWTMAWAAAQYGHKELVEWLCGEGGFAKDGHDGEIMMHHAAESGNLQLVQWLRGEGCPWGWMTCLNAVLNGHVEVLRWIRENGCPWDVQTRDRAAWAPGTWPPGRLGYTDNFGNLVDGHGRPVQQQ